MNRGADSIAALRDRAIAGVEDLVSVLGIGRALGIGVPTDDEIRALLARTGRVDIAGLSGDARALAAAHRALADQLHRLPEQQVRLDHGWSGRRRGGAEPGSGAAAVTSVIAHQRHAESDLDALRSIAEAATAATAGIESLLRTWYLTVARLSTPLVAGVAPAELPMAVLTGRVPLPVISADIASRVTLLHSTAETTGTTIAAILGTLNRSADGWAPGTGTPPSRSRAVTVTDRHGGGTADTGRSGAAERGTGDPAGVATQPDDHFRAQPHDPRPGDPGRSPGQDPDVPFTLSAEPGPTPAPDNAHPHRPTTTDPSSAVGDGRVGAGQFGGGRTRTPGPDNNPGPDNTPGPDKAATPSTDSDLALAGDQ